MTSYQDVKARVSLKEYADSRLEKKGKQYICPNCKSGTGPNGTPAFSIKGETWKCFRCQKGGDVFDLAAVVENLDRDNKRGQLEAVAAFANVPLEERPRDPKRNEEPQRTAQPKADYETARQLEAAKIRQAQRDIADPQAVEYMAARGITLADAQAWGLGYDKASRRLVIPWKGCDYYHADRDTTGKDSPKYKYPKSDEVGPRPLYNVSALSAPIVFIVEGALDALAVEGCGYQAVALGSNRNNQLADEVNARGSKGAFVLLLDADKAGDEGAADTAAALDALGVVSIRWTIEGHKDAAEAWQADREGLARSLAEAQAAAEQEQESRAAKEYARTLAGLRVFNPLDVVLGLYDADSLLDPIPTGFDGLDELLGGGLPRGLCVLGAVSSTGKTTYTLQLADTIAANGQPVLFVTIEQSAQEIAAKSLARIMRQRFGRGGSYMATAQEIASGKARRAWGEKQQAAFADACGYYTQAVADNLLIFEGRKQPTVSDVQTVAALMAERHGVAPVVFIDYLQLLAPTDPRDGTKEATDHNITALRQMARELQTPVFVISSLNRSSYGKGVTLDSFKESGAIEYGADVLLGLQPAGMLEKLDDIADEKKAKKEADKMTRESKAKQIRECELVVLKNRNGKLTDKGLPLTFYAVSGMFEERETHERESIRTFPTL